MRKQKANQRSSIIFFYTSLKGDTIMKKSEMKEFVRKAAQNKDLCRTYFKYDAYYTYHFPLLVNDKLFLSATEDDFILDGFEIKRFCDLKKVEVKDDMAAKITKAETKIFDLPIPQIDLSDWRSAFLSLQKIGRNIIIEHESLDENEWDFYIGHVVKVLKNKVIFKHFDADGIWQDEPYEIPFSKITSVTFGCRYVDIFSKYVDLK